MGDTNLSSGIDTKTLIKSLKPLTDRLWKGNFGIKTFHSDGSATHRWAHRLPTDQDFKDHLTTNILMGLGQIAPGESTTRVAIIDIDDKKEEILLEKKIALVKSIIVALKSQNIFAHPFTSSSGTGFHLIMLWHEPQEAKFVIQCITRALSECSLKKGREGLIANQVEIFPQNDYVPKNGLGGYVILPLGGKSKWLGKKELKWEMSFPVPILEKSVPSTVDSFDLDFLLYKKEPLGLTKEQRIEILNLIPPELSANNYDQYFEIVSAIHHETDGSEEGLQETKLYFSSYAPAYDEAEIDKTWKSCHSDKESCKTFATLIKKTNWKKKVPKEKYEFMRKANGLIKCNSHNTRLFVEDPELLGYDVRYDLAMDEIFLRKQHSNHWERMTNKFYGEFKPKMDRFQFEKTSTELLRESMLTVSMDEDHVIDSQKEDALEKEKNNPLDLGVAERWWIDCFGIADTPLAREAGKYFWSAMAGRAINPGVQVDMIIVLIGQQGLRKSSGIRAMLENPELHFTVVKFDDPDEKTIRNLRGCRIAEISELNGIRSKTAEHTKEFVVRTFDKWVPKYQEFSTIYPRRVVFVGTSNKKEFLDNDSSGQRRWLPFEVGTIDLEKIKKTRDQALAEGIRLYNKNGVMFALAEELARETHENFTREDVLESIILEYLYTSGIEYFKLTDILHMISKSDIDDRMGRRQDRIIEILRSNGYETDRMIDPITGKRSRFWAKKEFWLDK